MNRFSSKELFFLICIGGVVFFLGCASVPKESVDLSAQIGLDMEQLHSSHMAIIDLFFDQQEARVNEFVDTVYAPYHIHELLKMDYDDFKSGEEQSLFFQLDVAVKSGFKPGSQDSTVGVMRDYVELIHEELNDFRKIRLSKLVEQRQTLKRRVDTNYRQISYANSIVTANLASVLKVNEANKEALEAIGLDKISVQIDEGLIAISKELEKQVEEARKIDLKADDAFIKIEDAKQNLDALLGVN